jgi:AcrR family transcriptional regulator
MKTSSDVRASRGRPRSFDREAALEVAMRLFWRSGYEATSISDLAGAMGINPPSLYAAFGDKKALFREALAHYQSTRAGFGALALTREPTARQAIHALLTGAVRLFTDPQGPGGCMMMLSAINCTVSDHDVVEEVRGQRAEWQMAIRKRIQRAIDDGELPAPTNADALARYYTTVLEGLSIQARDGARANQLKPVVDLAMAAWPAPAATPARKK